MSKNDGKSVDEINEMLTKLKKERKTVRTAVTKITSSIEKAITDDNITDVEEQIELLKAKSNDLRDLNTKICDIIDESEMDAEFETAQEYENKIIIWNYRGQKFTKEKNKISTSPEPNCSSEISVNETRRIIPEFNVRLPKISISKYCGNPHEWQNFYNSFCTSIDQNPYISKIDKFNYLISLLDGAALNVVQGFSLSSENYDEALKLLKERFGRKDLLINAHMQEILNLQAVRSSNDLNALRKLYDTCNIQIRSLNSLGVKTETFGNLLCPLLMKCIPKNIALDYSRKRTSDDNFDVEHLMNFLKTEVESRERMTFLSYSNSETEKRVKERPAWEQNTNFNKFPPKSKLTRDSKNINKITAAPIKSPGCLFCEKEHKKEFCPLEPNERKQMLKISNRCFVCYERNCRRNCSQRCGICKSRFHGTLLHIKTRDENGSKEFSNENVLTARISSDKYFDVTQENGNKVSNIDTLQTVNLKVDDNLLTGILDTGAQITVIKSNLVPEKYKTPCGSVVLTCAFGQSLKAPLINVPITRVEDDLKFEEPVYITCAMIPTLSNDILLSLSALNELNCNLKEVNLSVNENSKRKSKINELECDSLNEDNFEYDVIKDDGIINIVGNEAIECDAIASKNIVKSNSEHVGPNEVSDAEKFRNEQKNDCTLNSCWQDAEKGINRFYVIDNFLYHRDSILGERVDQLVVPISRRKQLLTLAHSSLWGGHLRKKKTAERLRYSFYWPTMKKDIDEFCSSCTACQLQAKKRPFDEVPITPVSRPNEPFQIINVDLIGPIEPNSRGYKHVLCAVDQCTRWPEAIPLKTLTAKSTCDALLQIFTRTGIPKVVATDQGSNFNSALTKEFLKRLGSSPRFSTPGHPSSNGLVERFNAVLKGMIHHTMREHSKDWDKHIPFLLWAYREIPNATTGVSPFQMLYGRRPTGPLSILKSTWIDETLIPVGQLKSVTEYLNDLKMKLENAAEHAGLTAAGKQEAYAHYRNRKTRHKEFKEGDKVIVLVPDSENKVYARWTGPATIIKRKNTYSYLVQLPNDSVKHVHANKIREFKSSSNNVGVIYDTDIDFGEIENVPKITTLNPDPENDLTHLESSKREDIMKILKKHSNLRSGVPRIAHVGEHKIKLKQGSVPKKQKPFRIPEALKEEVDRQIEELLRLGLIVPSESEYAHPVVCVSKKDGSVRLCVDYRYLNTQTETDSFPMKNATDLIYQVSKAKYISLIDLLKGYWQIKLNPDCQDLTSFVTHRGQYSFVVLPFGLRNAAATFQRTMNELLLRHKDYAESYIDDVTIYSDDWSTHLKHLDAVMTTLEEANFTVNFQKCDFAKRKIKFLGHIVGSGSHEPDPEKVQAIHDLEAPKTKKDVRSTLGLLSYYRAYVPNFSDIARPLTTLTKRRSQNDVVWLSEHDQAFSKLKEAICNAPKCYSPNFKLPFTIYADASAYAVGACLAQKDEQNNEHPIAFASKKLTKAQENYAVIEKEAYAVIFALKKFETYIFGTEIIIVSDHNPLKFITNCASQSPRLQRWSLALQRFHATITYRKGKDHLNADSLSRLTAKHWKND